MKQRSKSTVRVLVETTALALLVVLFAATAYAGEPFNKRFPTKKGEMVIATNRDYDTLMPYDWIGGPPARQYFSVVECLYEYDKELNPQPLLAESIEYDQQNLKVTIHLRKGVKFHDGSEMKASDAVYSMKYLGKSRYGKNYPSYDFEGIEATGDYSFVLPLKELVGPLLDQLTTVFIFPQANTEKQGDKVGHNMVGSGPFKQGKWVPGDYLVLDRFDDYWGAASSVKRITMRFVAEASVSQIELESGGIDLSLNVLGTDYKRVKNQDVKGFEAYMGPAITVNFVHFNCANGPLKDKRVRKAIAYATNRQAVLESAFEGVGEISWSNFAPASMGYDPQYAEEKKYDYDLDKAKALMAEAGYPDGFELRAVVDPITERGKTLEVMIDNLAKIGIKMSLQQYDSAAAMDIHTNTNDWDITARRMNLAADPSNDLLTLTHPVNTAFGGSCLMRHAEDPEAWKYGELLEKAAKTVDPAERIAIYREAQALMMENLWIFPTHVGGEKAIYPQEMKGFWYAGVFPHYDDIYFEK